MEQTIELPQNGDDGSRAYAVIEAALALPHTKVNRAFFLRDQLRAHCSERQVELAIEFNPAHARMPIATIDRIAESVIRSQNMKAAAGSFVAGIPGGLAMAVTVPLDLAQNTGHAIVLAQKLAYLYGWPELFHEGAPDEETQARMAMLLGSMLGLRNANILLSEVSSRFTSEVANRLPSYALTKTAYYPVIREICKWLGIKRSGELWICNSSELCNGYFTTEHTESIERTSHRLARTHNLDMNALSPYHQSHHSRIKLTKTTFAQGVAKLIPVVSGGISATVTGVVQRKMAFRLKNHLRELEYAQPSQDKPTTIIIES